MYIKKECVAMLLAGGQGSRLYALTQDMAKPAVPYGGKYRIIDFPLSNCTNSGIDTVGVLTQYQPLVLNDYIGNGQPWDLDKLHGGVHVLPPYQTNAGASWYEGTANAIYQNMSFIERYDPEYVIVLGGDHIYRMDYSKMLQFHKQNQADCTIAVQEVSLEEATRLGIMTCDKEGRVVEFAEKPKEPKSTLASMGIYIFTWKKLKQYLIENENANTGSKDFGKDIIPAMLAAGERLFAYAFEGYWKDVGTLDSLWEANMDLLSPSVPLDLYDKEWKIYSRNLNMPPQYIGDKAAVENSMISEGCEINGTVDFSIIFSGAVIEENATVKYSIIMPGTVVKAGAVVEYSIVGEDCVIHENAHVGASPETIENRDEWGIAVVGHKVDISEGKAVLPKQIISDNL
ncbi:glucose-1-phosphate adenylyltransferase [Ruminococcus sp.]|uniref:glucose-1-phosphate adenylyltransferase n=1 Tax=Ruminococcus sp. TaxID=41978 RepID=UPI0025EF1B65|nr:glucose-1-phosphate adenylyltransferase [Ruminococcus sp.]MCI5816160.1 glucose-1-phosphate adenylyltransferase [Ruminococcus sp.]MDD7556703.1 glucose-1-phosphate adenylyltransferase [Ruminococcus sp.]MDY4963309.1 glucose-1-phosphate adenylyltransferase [Ruminococcus callidus]